MSDIENREDDGRLQSVFEVAKNEAREKYKGSPLKALVIAMQRAKARKEQLEELLKAANAEFDVLRFEMVPTKMDDEGVERVAYDGIGRVSLTPDLMVAVKPNMKDQLFGWMKKHKMGDLIQPSINPSTLKAWVKARQKKAQPIPDEFLNLTPVTRASITKL